MVAEAASAQGTTRTQISRGDEPELRTPIGAISSYADILVEGVAGPVSVAQEAQLKRIKVVATRQEY